MARRFAVTVAADAPICTRPYFSRAVAAGEPLRARRPAAFGRPASAPPLVAVARYAVDGRRRWTVREVVRRREAQLPYGYVMRELRSRAGAGA